MDGFDALFVTAARRTVAEYFLLPIHGAHARYRERVYCYELYHQLRTQWPPNCPFFLNGEADKNAHPYFAEVGGAPKPDFIVHVPGTGNNYAVIEVKSSMATDGGIRDDLEKLLQFRGIGYTRALYLIYGLGPEDVLARVNAAGATADQMAAIEIWVHPYAGAPAARAH